MVVVVVVVLVVSINQSEFCSHKIHREAWLSGETVESVSSDKILRAVQTINGPLGMLVFIEERPNQRKVFRRFRKVAIEGGEWIDNRRLFHGEGAQD